MRDTSKPLFQSVQSKIVKELEKIEQNTFKIDIWDRLDENGFPGGGGITKILNGKIFEKAGVNFSEVYGTPPKQLKMVGANKEFYATGVSLVIHPYSPLVPTIHANFRYIEIDNTSWFGGGIDLTPYYLNELEVIEFHTKIKNICDQHNPLFYHKFKKECDEYFYLPHRLETRGVGGIFFDYLGKDQNLESYFEFISNISNSFCQLYIPIVLANKDLEFSKEQKDFQLYRRGRYVEFNLLYDRGTKFGLETNGRTESILMSLPANVKWEYCREIKDNSEEAKLINVLKNPRDWI